MGRPSLPNLLLHLLSGQFIILRPFRYFMVNIPDPLAANKRLKLVGATTAKSLQSCPTLSDPTDGSPPGSPVPGILQARTLAAAAAKSLQSSPTLCDPTDGSPPGSPVPWILQARTLEWVAIPFSNA